MSLYADYLKEREGKEIFECEDGFVTYSIYKGDVSFVYIEDIYVVPHKRKMGLAGEWADQICEKALKEYGCAYLLGSVDVTARGATDSVKVLLSYGMKVQSTNGNMIYFKKDF
jgi:hypothetical protein